MAAANTYREQQDRVLDLISKSDSTTRNRIKNWLNLGYQDFVGRELWPFRETVDTISFIQGTSEYTLSSEFADIDTGNIVSVAIQGGNMSKLSYIPITQLLASEPDLTSIGQAVPRQYYIRSGKIGFWPTPNGTDSVSIAYYATPTEMSADSDEPIIPKAYREALVQYALSLEHDFNTDPDLAQKAMNRYEQIVTLARLNLLTQPNDTGAFVIMGPADSKNWTSLSGNVN